MAQYDGLVELVVLGRRVGIDGEAAQFADHAVRVRGPELRVRVHERRHTVAVGKEEIEDEFVVLFEVVAEVHPAVVLGAVEPFDIR